MRRPKRYATYRGVNSYVDCFQTLKRQETRRLTTAREIIENDRLERLKNLGGVLHKFRSLDASGRHRVVDMMRESAPKDEPPPFVLSDNLFAPSGWRSSFVG